MIHSTAAGMMTHNPLTKYAMTLHVKIVHSTMLGKCRLMEVAGSLKPA